MAKPVRMTSKLRGKLCTTTTAWRHSNTSFVISLMVISCCMCIYVGRVTQLLFETELVPDSMKHDAQLSALVILNGTYHSRNNTFDIPGSDAVASVANSGEPMAHFPMNESLNDLPSDDTRESGSNIHVSNLNATELKIHSRPHDAITEYKCVSWRQTKSCSPNGPQEFEHDKPCGAAITRGNSGFCELEHKTTGERLRVLPVHSTSLSTNAAFRCDQFVELLEYGDKATVYSHDSNFSYAKNQEDFLAFNSLRVAPSASFFQRGIVMVVYERVLLGAYASIRSLREQISSTLPVEMWYRRDEMDPNHPLLQTLVANYSVYLREMKDPLATGFYTKLHAVFYSAFDSVLLLDADNYAVKDPSYLFDTHEFTSNGAIFWPDFWKAGNTLFNIHADSVVWEIFALSFVDMFEQESGQVLIDRRRHFTALNALMYYGFSLPRIPEQIEVVWGDKDLFRFAWLKTNSTFHMIARPPGTAGKFNSMTKKYCGLTMVQHDPEGKIVFLHRNVEKIRDGNRQLIWTHVQEFKKDAPMSAYRIAWAKVYDAHRNCWGQSVEWNEHYTVQSFTGLFGDFEPALLRLPES